MKSKALFSKLDLGKRATPKGMEFDPLPSFNQRNAAGRRDKQDPSPITARFNDSSLYARTVHVPLASKGVTQSNVSSIGVARPGYPPPIYRPVFAVFTQPKSSGDVSVQAPPVYKPGNQGVTQPRGSAMPAKPTGFQPPALKPATRAVLQPKPTGARIVNVQAPPVYKPSNRSITQSKAQGMPTIPAQSRPPILKLAGRIVTPPKPIGVQAVRVQAPPVYKPNNRNSAAQPGFAGALGGYPAQRTQLFKSASSGYRALSVDTRVADSVQASRRSVPQNPNQAVHKFSLPIVQLKAKGVIQRVVYPNVNALLAAVVNANNLAANKVGVAPTVDDFDPAVSILFEEAEAYLSDVDVQIDNNMARPAAATQATVGLHPYILKYKATYPRQKYLLASILHELMHVTVEENYDKAGLPATFSINFNLPHGMGVGNNLNAHLDAQEDIIDENLADAKAVVNADNSLSGNMQAHIIERLDYAEGQKDVHYDTVLGDILAYMNLKGATDSPTFRFMRRLSEEARDRRTRQPLFGIPRETQVRRVRKDAYWFQFWEW